MNNKRDDKSHIAKIGAAVVGVILILATAFVFLAFRTDYIFNVEADRIVNSADFDKTSVTTVIEEIDRLESGVGVPVIENSTSLEELFEYAGYNTNGNTNAMRARRCYGMATTAKHMIEAGFSYEQVAGLLGNNVEEGAPGCIEVIVYLSDSDKGAVHNCAYRDSSSQQWWYRPRAHIFHDYDPATEPDPEDAVHELFNTWCIRDNSINHDIQLLLPINEDHNQPGIGMSQWSGNRRIEVLNRYIAANVQSIADIANVEGAYAVEEFRGTYASAITGATPYDIGVNVLEHYEIPENAGAEIKNTRGSNAENIYRILVQWDGPNTGAPYYKGGQPSGVTSTASPVPTEEPDYTFDYSAAYNAAYAAYADSMGIKFDTGTAHSMAVSKASQYGADSAQATEIADAVAKDYATANDIEDIKPPDPGLVKEDIPANVESIYNWIVAHGWSKEAACGILGNMEHESQFKPTAENDNYKGLCQWYKADRWKNCLDFCTREGYDPDSVEGQLNFMLYEATNTDYPDKNSPFNLSAIAADQNHKYRDEPCHDAAYAAYIWERYFERAVIKDSGGGGTYSNRDLKYQECSKRCDAAVTKYNSLR
ncbi:MAG: phage tail tip lysozyme [Lachnospiraceae bacterium]|nr:phage tail tip lysozyme [Lachnospiraceae bacterium]MCM1233823.1 phage tail tip lysozyme [Ruminococcus flavefaciens]